MGSARSFLATLGLPLLTSGVLSRSTLLRLQVALPGNCLRWALGCVHFPDLCYSGSGSQVLHKGTDSVGPAFCALPRLEQLRQPGAWQAHSPQVGSASYHLPGPGHSGSTVSGVPCVSSGELISGCDLPGRCPGSQEDLVSSWEPAHRLVEDVLSGAEIAAAPCLQALAVSSLLLCLCAGRGRYTAC